MGQAFLSLQVLTGFCVRVRAPERRAPDPPFLFATVPDDGSARSPDMYPLFNVTDWPAAVEAAPAASTVATARLDSIVIVRVMACLLPLPPASPGLRLPN